MFNLDEDQTPLKTLATDTYNLNHICSIEGKNDTTTFFSFKCKHR